MWTRARIAARSAAQDLQRAAGTPRASLPLALLGAAGLVADAIWRLREGAHPLAGTSAWWILAIVMLADAAFGVLRALPWRQRPDGTLERVPLAARGAGALLLRLSWLLLACAFLASTAARDRLVFRVAVGERFVASPEQLVRRDPLRAMSRAPPAVDLEVVRVDGGGAGAGALRAALRTGSGGTVEATRVWPAWLGWDRYLRAVGAGVAVRYEVASTAGSPLDSAIAKLEPPRAGESRLIRLDVVPLRVVVAGPHGADAPGAPPALRVGVYRGKLLVAEGEVREGRPLRVDGVDVSFPEWRPWVELEMVRDPGVPLAAAGVLLALAGGALRLRRDVAAPPAPGGAAPGRET
jgi:hypothetical protein